MMTESSFSGEYSFNGSLHIVFAATGGLDC